MPIRESYRTHRRAHVDWPSVNDPLVRQDAWDRATMWRDHGDYLEALADVADAVGLQSGLAAWDAIINYAAARHGYSHDDGALLPSLERWAARVLGWPLDEMVGFSGREDTLENYIRPTSGDPPHHSEGCDCDDCNPCDCNGPHCERCYPDGPPDWCDCREYCNPPVLDDEQDDDHWEGRPEIPPDIPGRCRFGIEVEFNDGDRGEIAQAIQRAGIACTTTQYTHDVVRYWKMTSDSSVTGGECVSPIMAGDDASIEEVREVIRQVKAHGGTTGHNVGMHVHLDITTLNNDQLVALCHNLRRTQMTMAGFLPKHRYAENEYTRLITDPEWAELEHWLSRVDVADRRRSRENRGASGPISGRYVSYNFNALLTYGTVECRLLGHTLNTIKVRSWIRVLQATVEASRQLQRMPDGDVLTWLTEFGLEQEHAEHFRSVVTRRGNQRMLVAA